MGYAAFFTVSLFWGLTWLAGKIGVSAVPPQFYTSTRFFAAWLLLSAWLTLRGRGLLPPRRLVPGVLAVACLTMMASPGLNFWGLTRTGSSVAAVVNLALTPIALYVVGLIAGEERMSARLNLALALGVLGLALLFAPRVATASADLLGLIAIVVGTSCYATGSVIGRRLLPEFGALKLSAITSLIGGSGLMAVSLAVEHPDASTLAAFASRDAFACWLFMLLGGSLLATPVYFWLLREWGPARSGLYAFVSPVIAVMAGVLVLDERVTAIEAVGMAAMLVATWIALGRRA
jgi:drug/metabolite transporter (DMT)-like permease